MDTTNQEPIVQTLHTSSSKGLFKVVGIVVVLVLLLALTFMFSQKRNTIPSKISTSQPTQSLEVATDPHFLEVKGQILSGFPQFPLYPGATLVASAKTAPEGQQNTGYRVKWTVKASVPVVMKWYQQEVTKNGWTIESSNDPENTGEQVTHIENNQYKGTLGIEAGEADVVEIVVDVRIMR